MYGIDLGTVANLFCCFFSLHIEKFFSNTKWILGFMQYSEFK